MKKTFIFTFLSLANLWLNPVCVGAETAAPAPSPSPKSISIRQDASRIEWLAANEVRRYVWLRTGELLPVEREAKAGNRIVVSAKDPGFCGDLGKELESQQFTLKTDTAGENKVWWIVGGDGVGALYGAYRFVETLGVRFSLEGDAVPDERMSGAWPEVNESGKPKFALRGLQPFHDFQMGPDWWNLQDYESVLTQMAKMRMNFIGIHTYPSWNPASGPEANVWIGLPEDVDEQGNVRFGYEAGVVTTRKGWMVTPFPTSNYAAGAGLLFEGDEYGPDFMLDCLDWPKTEEAATTMFNRYGDLQRDAFTLARQLGIKTAVGTELPLGIASGLAAHLASKGMKADDPAVIQRLYEGTFLRIMRKMPVDYFWFWTPEVWLNLTPGQPGWEVTSIPNTERDLSIAVAATRAMKTPFTFATSGWRLGTREDPLWMHNRAPKEWVASSINTSVGWDPVEKSFGAMPDRSKWVIGWAEADSAIGAHNCACWDLELSAARMLGNAADAARHGAEGLMAIHWRTASLAPTMTALAQAGWQTDIADKPVDMQAFWSEWGRGMFGGEAGAEAGRIVQKFDGGHRNSTTPGYFAPLDELEALRPRISGAGNLERFDYWRHQIRSTKWRLQAWAESSRLATRLQEIQALPQAEEKTRLTRAELLPMRIALARSYEEAISSIVASAKTPGELGTITSIESGNRNRIVMAQDAAIAGLLGEPLPPEAAIRTAYQGEPRIFVSANRTLAKAGQAQELRPFVLSETKCTSVDLYWRPLGATSFEKVPATHRARQAYRVSLPAQVQGTAEYYLEASLEGGSTVRWPATAPAINQTVVIWEN